MRPLAKIFLLVILIMATASQTTEAKPYHAYSPPSSITIWVYHLRGDGSIDPYLYALLPW